jgi:ATP-binding cassette subfamily B protein
MKPYLGLVLLCIALLFVQAYADLALPGFLSQIVNTGIQQGGVDDSVPEALRASSMEHLLLFAEPQAQTLILSSYSLVEPNTPEAEEYLEQYPVLAEEPVYVLKTLDEAQTAALAQAITDPLVIVYSLETALADPAAAAQMFPDAPVDPSQLPPGMDLFDLLAQAPPQMLAQVQAAAEARLQALSPAMIEQVAAQAIKAEYTALGMDMTRLQTAYILSVGGMMLLVSLIGGLCTIATGYLAARTAAGAARDIRRDTFKKVESFSSGEFDQFSTASLITRSTNDVTQVQMVIFMFIRMVFFAPIIGIGGIILAYRTAPSMSWIIALAVLVLVSVIALVFSITLPRFQIMQKLVDRLNLVTRENLSGMMVIRAFNKQAFETQRFEQANLDLTDTNLFIARVMATMMPVMMLIMNGISLLIIWVGAHQVAEATIQVGDMMAFMQYAMQIVFSFLMMSMMVIFLPRAAVSGGRIADVLETPISIQDPAQPAALPEPFAGQVEFREVAFRYPGAQDDVLREISFTARPGQTTAIIGSTGCGKSTVINLIPRFYDVTAGAVTIDGVDVRQLSQAALRDKIGYIPQKGMLFSGTIESNLRYADQNASPERLQQAAEIAQAAEFIQAKEQGLASEISQGGTNVSGGQKQRLAIARALVKQPPIYIFDDSFSALDFKTDAALRRALKEKTGKSTIIIVTQRVATIKNADQIIVLDEGRVVGKGAHQQLMQDCETYREIAFSQLSAEELS